MQKISLLVIVFGLSTECALTPSIFFDKSTRVGELTFEYLYAQDGGQSPKPLRLVTNYYDICQKSRSSILCIPPVSDECFTQRNCRYGIIWSAVPDTDYVNFLIISSHQKEKRTGQSCNVLPDRKKYIAIGFSNEKLQAETDEHLVLQCTYSERQATVKLAWSSGSDYISWNHVCNPKMAPEAKLKDCIIDELPSNNFKCEFKVKKRLVVQSVIYHLNLNALGTYKLHLSSGCDVSDLKNGFHKGGDYKSFRMAKTDYRTTLKLCHGCLMILAFCVFIPNGVFLARYFKESFVHFAIFKYRIWFVSHAFFQSLATILACIATVVVMLGQEIHEFFSIGDTTTVHNYLGSTALLCLVLQHGTGWIKIRGSKLRRIVACIHLIIGTTCYIFSQVVIAKSHTIGMPRIAKYYILGTVGWTLVFHALMSVHFFITDNKLGLSYPRALFPFPLPPVTYDEMQGSRFRLGIFGIHFLGTVLLSSAMIYEYIAIDDAA